MQPRLSERALFDQVEAVLDSMRPFLRKDDGDATLVKVDQGVAHIALLGACASCPMSDMTLHGIAKKIAQQVPEVQRVVQVQQEA